jgi:hypothetical protein
MNTPTETVCFNRHGEKRFVRSVDENTYVVYGKSNYFRVGEDFFDFEGGPFISIGMSSSILDIDGERKVKSIKPLECKDQGYAECLIEVS